LVIGEELWATAEWAQEKRRVKDPWETTLHAALNGDGRAMVNVVREHTDQKGQKLKVVSTDMLMGRALNIPVERRTREMEMRLANVMRGIGWKRPDNGKVKVDGAWVRGYQFMPEVLE
jgi:hypothetical protein